jgi:hypothetical protein
LFAALLLCATGCDDEETPSGPLVDLPETLPFPDSADQLMANFQTLYEDMDFQEYERLLAPEFETHLQEQTTHEFPGVGGTLDFQEEMRIHERMFSGDALTDQNGNFIPAVMAISLQGFRRAEDWAVAGPDDVVPGAEWAPYEVDILFDRGQQYSYLRAQGIIKFYVTSRDSVHRGSTKKYYQMVGQVDWTGLGKPVEDASWGSIKSLFH